MLSQCSTAFEEPNHRVTADPPPPGAPIQGAVRVASIPHRDPYVDAVLPWGAVHVGPAVGSPSPWLDAAYLAEHAAEIFDQARMGRVALVSCDDWTGTDYLSNVVVMARPTR